MSSLVVVIVIAGIITLMFLMSGVGMIMYQWLRRPLYDRPLTDDEKWAETTQQNPEALVTYTGDVDEFDIPLQTE